MGKERAVVEGETQESNMKLLCLLALVGVCLAATVPDRSQEPCKAGTPDGDVLFTNQCAEGKVCDEDQGFETTQDDEEGNEVPVILYYCKAGGAPSNRRGRNKGQENGGEASTDGGDSDAEEGVDENNDDGDTEEDEPSARHGRRGVGVVVPGSRAVDGRPILLPRRRRNRNDGDEPVDGPVDGRMRRRRQPANIIPRGKVIKRFLPGGRLLPGLHLPGGGRMPRRFHGHVHGHGHHNGHGTGHGTGHGHVHEVDSMEPHRVGRRVGRRLTRGTVQRPL